MSVIRMVNAVSALAVAGQAYHRWNNQALRRPQGIPEGLVYGGSRSTAYAGSKLGTTIPWPKILKSLRYSANQPITGTPVRAQRQQPWMVEEFL